MQSPASSFCIQNVFSQRRDGLATERCFQESFLYWYRYRPHSRLVLVLEVSHKQNLTQRGGRDTVGSVGMIPKRLPFTTFNTHVKAFRHALALDEHRVRFKPNFFNRPTHEELELGLKWGEVPKNVDRKPHRRRNLREFERQYGRGGSHQTDVKEVWFAGCHCGTWSQRRSIALISLT